MRYRLIVTGALLLCGCSVMHPKQTRFLNGEPRTLGERLLGLPRGRLRPEQAAVLMGRFAQLQPPFDSVAARKILGDPAWLDRVRLERIRMLTGFIPLHGDSFAGSLFLVWLQEATSQEYAGYAVSLHTTAAIDTEEDLRRFFRGEGGAAMRVDEFTLSYPEGFLLSVRNNKREFIEDIHGHNWSPR